MRISKTKHLKRLLITQDVLIALLAYVLSIDIAWWLSTSISNDGALGHFSLLPFVFTFALVAARFERPVLHGQATRLVVFRAARYAAFISICLLATAYFAKLEFVSRYSLVVFGVLMVSGIVVNRLFLRWWYFHRRKEHPDNFLKVLIVGTNKRAQGLIEAYRSNSEWGIDIVGVLDPDPSWRESEFHSSEVLGDLSNIRQILSENVVDELVVCLPRSLLDDVTEVVDACEEQAVSLKFLADFYEFNDITISLEHIGSWPVLNIDPVVQNEKALIVKRIFDLMLVIPALITLVPFFALIAFAIKLDSKGPVFFAQTRVGLNKRSFKMIKFRSMHQNAESMLSEIEHLNEADGPIFKMENDPRVTRVGGFLRKTSIDELPQLFNVLLGQMSLIGPRPMSLRDVEQFSKGVQRKRFSVRPGLACLREVQGRSRLSFDQWLTLDLQYIDQWTLWLDLKILLLLVPAVLKGDGAS